MGDLARPALSTLPAVNDAPALVAAVTGVGRMPELVTRPALMLLATTLAAAVLPPVNVGVNEARVAAVWLYTRINWLLLLGSIWISVMPAATAAAPASTSAFLATMAEQVCAAELPVTPAAGAAATVTPMNTLAAVAVPAMATVCLGN